VNGIDAHALEAIAQRHTGHTLHEWYRAHDHKRNQALEWIYKRRLIFPSEFVKLVDRADIEPDDFVLILVPAQVVQQYRRYEPDYDDETGKTVQSLIMYAHRLQITEVEPNVYSL
jgi:hypothetical protein